MISKQRGAGVIVSILLAGCTVGPNYQPQQSKMPAGWVPPTSAPTTQQSITTVETPDVSRWWTAFADPTLNSLVDRAVKANLDLQIATNRIRQARASWTISRSNLFPFVDTSASYSRSGTVSGSSRDLYRAGLDASWELDVFGGNRRSVEAAAANIDVSVEDRRDALVILTSEVAFNYIDLRSFQQQIDIAYKNLTAQSRSADLTRQRARAGFVGALDTANADAQMASTESAIPSLQAAVRQSIYALSVLLGEEPATLLKELSETAAIPVTPPRVPVGLPSELLRRRPDIRSAEAQLRVASANIGVAVSDLYPRFTLNGAFNLSANRPAPLFNLREGAWSIGPNVSWNIFDAGRIRANIEIQNIAQETALLSYQRTILTALQDVENSLVSYETEQRRRGLLAVAVDANRRALDLSTRLYTSGQTGFLDVLNAERSLFSSEVQMVQSDRTIASNLISLYKALGGGWEFESDAPTTQPTANQ